MTIKKVLIALVIIVALGVIAFFYFTRPAAAPTGLAPANSQTTADTNKTNYKIGSDSRASFEINEVLNGKPFTAIGSTESISGTLSIDASGNLSMGTISVNARTFKTDSEKRDGAIARFILKSETPENEFITFTPTSISSKAGEPGPNNKKFFDVTGNLTIAGITKPATFAVSFATFADKEHVYELLQGDASTTIKRSDFDLKIPNVPFVASVSDQFSIRATIYADKM